MVEEEVCGCGDYRSQHPSDGRCSACFGSSAPWDGCRFYWPDDKWGVANARLTEQVRVLTEALAPLDKVRDESLLMFYRMRFADRDDYDYGDDAAWVAAVRDALAAAKGETG